MDIVDPPLPGPTPEPWEPRTASAPVTTPPRRTRRPLVVALVMLGTLVSTSAVAAAFIRLPYDTVAPGSAKVVNDLVTISDHPTYPPTGEVLYTTVSVRQRVNAYQALIGWLDPEIDVVHEEKVRGNIPPDQYRRLNVEAMNDSKTSAEVVALGRIGFTQLGVGGEVVSVEPGSPAASILHAKDVIVAVNDKPIATSGDAVTAIREHQPGSTLRIRAMRGDQTIEQVTELAQAPDGRPFLGVRLTTKIRLPFEIKIDSGNVVGPSAGLAYALELLDVLTPGELTGGTKVAATGDLSADGRIGAIGGVAQKAVTVRRAGASIFLVPKANEAEAQAGAGGGLLVRGVETFDEALQILATVQGSNALELASPAAPR